MKNYIYFYRTQVYWKCINIKEATQKFDVWNYVHVFLNKSYEPNVRNQWELGVSPQTLSAYLFKQLCYIIYS